MKVIGKMCVDDYAKISVCAVNKEDAKEMLSRNSKNRPLSRSNVEKLKKSMNDGKWLFNGDTIVLDSDGFLKSGQHRLTAFVESEMNEVVLVVVSLFNDHDVLTTLNRGKSMSTAQYLKIIGIQESQKVNAISKGLIKVFGGGTFADDGATISDYEVEECYRRHSSVIDDFVKYCTHDSNGICTTLAAAMVFASIVRPDKKENLEQICKNVSECVSSQGSIENCLIRMNRSFRGFLGRALVGKTFRKFISVIGEYIATGKVKDKVYGISEKEFMKLIKKEAK